MVDFPLCQWIPEILGKRGVWNFREVIGGFSRKPEVKIRGIPPLRRIPQYTKKIVESFCWFLEKIERCQRLGKKSPLFSLAKY